MQKIILALAFGSAAAFVPASVSRSAPSTRRDELIDLAEGSTEGLSPAWDPLGCSACRSGRSTTTRPSATCHAEIKHGRIAMAGFLGYCVVP